MKRARALGMAIATVGCAIACGGTSDVATGGAESAVTLNSSIQRVFVVAMENHSASAIYTGKETPFITGLVSQYASATDYSDDLSAKTPSEPHYIEMEAGTNALPDRTFTTDAVPSGTNSSKSHLHLSHLLENAGIPWRAYEEGLDGTTGACPVNNHYDSANASQYAVRHDPFVYFTDVSGSPPSAGNATCATHFKPFSALAGDVSGNTVANYNFITPNLCHDMHLQGCGTQTEAEKAKAADTWMKNLFAYLVPYVNAHSGVIFVVWDEPEGGTLIPFLVVGPHLKSAGYKSTKPYIHASLVKSLQEIFEVSPTQSVPWLGNASKSSTNDFSDFFTAGSFP